MKTMKNRMVLKWTAVGMLSMSVMLASAQAQQVLSDDVIISGDLNVGTSGTTGNLTVTAGAGYSGAPALKVIGYDGVLFTGSFNGGEIPVEGPGTRMMWYPGQGAFRAGTVTNTGNWDMGYVGNYSVAFGLDTYASEYSMAAGNNSWAYAAYSMAAGNNSWAYAEYTMAFGNSACADGGYSLGFGMAAQALGGYSLAFGNTAITEGGSYCLAFGNGAYASYVSYSMVFGNGAQAYGNYALAFGNGVFVGGPYSMAFGENVVSNASYSLSFGNSTSTYGEYALAFGNEATASASYSMAFGDHTTSSAYGAVAFGRYNVGGYNAGEDGDSTWVETDPIFEIGIGTSGTSTRNAVTVYKNGDVRIPKRQGDILMGEFGE